MIEWIIEHILEFAFTIVVGLLTCGYASIAKRVKQDRREQEAIRAGVQALLRAQMVTDYNKWSERRWAPIYARENFKNCWEQYENLGENGVMGDIYKKFLALPTQPPDNDAR